MSLAPITLNRRYGLPSPRSPGLFLAWNGRGELCTMWWSGERGCWECAFHMADGEYMTAFANTRGGYIAAHVPAPHHEERAA